MQPMHVVGSTHVRVAVFVVAFIARVVVEIVIGKELNIGRSDPRWI